MTQSSDVCRSAPELSVFELEVQLTPSDDDSHATADVAQTSENGRRRRRRCHWQPTAGCHSGVTPNETLHCLLKHNDT